MDSSIQDILRAVAAGEMPPEEADKRLEALMDAPAEEAEIPQEDMAQDVASCADAPTAAGEDGQAALPETALTRMQEVEPGGDTQGEAPPRSKQPLPDQQVHCMGNYTGDIDGNLIAHIMGNMEGDVAGDLRGTVLGNMKGSVRGDMAGTILGGMSGSVGGNLTGKIMGDMSGSIAGDLRGSVMGSLGSRLHPEQCHVGGNLAGAVRGSVHAVIHGNLEGTVNGNIYRICGDIGPTGKVFGSVQELNGACYGRVMGGIRRNGTEEKA